MHLKKRFSFFVCRRRQITRDPLSKPPTSLDRLGTAAPLLAGLARVTNNPVPSSSCICTAATTPRVSRLVLFPAACHYCFSTWPPRGLGALSPCISPLCRRACVCLVFFSLAAGAAACRRHHHYYDGDRLVHSHLVLRWQSHADRRTALSPLPLPHRGYTPSSRAISNHHSRTRVDQRRPAFSLPRRHRRRSCHVRSRAPAHPRPLRRTISSPPLPRDRRVHVLPRPLPILHPPIQRSFVRSDVRASRTDRIPFISSPRAHARTSQSRALQSFCLRVLGLRRV